MFNILKRISVSTYRLLAMHLKLIAFEYENKEGRESNNDTKRLIWSSFTVLGAFVLTLNWEPTCVLL